VPVRGTWRHRFRISQAHFRFKIEEITVPREIGKQREARLIEKTAALSDLIFQSGLRPGATRE
jgi:hypothetical protein